MKEISFTIVSNNDDGAHSSSLSRLLGSDPSSTVNQVCQVSTPVMTGAAGHLMTGAKEPEVGSSWVRRSLTFRNWDRTRAEWSKCRWMLVPEFKRERRQGWMGLSKFASPERGEPVVLIGQWSLVST